jgi:hypothetical protein
MRAGIGYPTLHRRTFTGTVQYDGILAENVDCKGGGTLGFYDRR